MLNLAIDAARSRGLLRELIDDTETEIRRHQQVIPGFADHAAGRDFADHGAALDRIFVALHDHHLQLMRRSAEVAAAAHHEVTTVAEADEASAHSLNAVNSAIAEVK